MPFPVSVSGAIRLPLATGAHSDVEKVAACIEYMLLSASARSVTGGRDWVSFKGGLFRLVTNWNVLVPFGYGVLRIYERERELEVQYDLSTMELVTMITALICVGTVFIIIADINNNRPTNINLAWQIVVGWTFLVVANYVTGMFRFRWWLERGLRENEPVESDSRADLPD